MAGIGKFFGFGEREYDYGPNVEVESSSFLERLGNACVGLCIGIVLFFVSFGLLGWNEERYIKTWMALDNGRDAYTTAECQPVDNSLTGKLVHISCDLENMHTFSLPEFKENLADFTGIFLEIYAEMYQWEEQKETETKKDKLGGGTQTITRYHYRESWSPTIRDSTFFYNKDYKNPPSFPALPEARQVAPDLRAGSYKLTYDQTNRFSSREELTLLEDRDYTASSTRPPPTVTAANTQLYNDMLWTGDPFNPQIGDVRVKFYGSTATSCSVVAQLTSDGSFEPWPSPYDSDYTVNLFEEGKVSGGTMFDHAEQENTFLMWMLRLLGFLCMWMGLQMFFGPLAIVPDIIPCVGPYLGDMVGCLLCAANCLVATFLSLLTIAIAWVIVRPWVGIPLLCGALVALGIFIAVRCIWGRREEEEEEDDGMTKIPMYQMHQHGY
ncbi:unnamed protein product [Vitrella brassicaformis CCMP3155]|uniref:Transmembrane protein n=1 Tax=Vitrella brassicaformis (strain CCMP3155) TaxID=1169540 RepID=A0A0G4FTE1_VITBC|nr:unnamed protein product [Vitrella brassicaformis CCMP3155]|eukprot:CEM17739.1 unnamed protein product [Vitrella brassicaformis CCMP3155]